MSIITTVSEHQFVQAFTDYNRESNFSYAGRQALFQYIDNISDEIEQPIELDIINLCCSYSEYANLAELQKEYDNIESFDDLEQHTTIIYTADYQDPDAPFIIHKY